MNRFPELVTFASNKEDVICSVKAGIDHIVLEHSDLSLRSFYDDFDSGNFLKITDLARLARSLKPDIVLSFNIDIIIHREHFKLVEEVLEVLDKIKINIVRVQDLGLVLYLRKLLPDLDIHFSPQTGNNNIYSTYFFSKKPFPNIQRQILTNELSSIEVREIVEFSNNEFEYQVHGRVLLQYSRRRLLGFLKNNKLNLGPIEGFAKNEINEEGGLCLYDNVHGTSVFHESEKCLLENIPELMGLKLRSWLIDLRGKGREYLALCINAYRIEIEKYMQDPDAWKVPSEKIILLQTCSRKDFSKFFFNSIKSEELEPLNLKKSEMEIAGIILDVVKFKSVVIEIYCEIKKGQDLFFLNPYGKKIRFQINQFTDIWDNPISCPEENSLIKIPWFKGAISDSLFLIDQ